MAKKRKLPPKSAATAASAAAVEAEPEPEPEPEPQPQQEQQNEEQEQKQEEIVENPEAVDPETQDLEVEVQGDEHQEPEVKPQNDETAPTEIKTEVEEAGNDDDDDDEAEEEPVQKLLEPFTKDQLIEILVKAAGNHSDVLDEIRKISDTDQVHRKIFVHGLGWDTNAETLTQVFGKYGEIEDMNAVCDKATGKSKGYAFILFKTRSGARKALKEPQKKIGSRMTACQLASAGPVPTNAHVHSQPFKAPVNAAVNENASEYTQRKIYVSNVAENIDPQKLVAFFSKFGEIEEGPLGLDKVTGKPKGFALFVYKSVESARKALEEPHKTFEGHILNCQKAIDGPKPSKANYNQYQQQSHGGGRPSKFARTDKSSFGGSHAGGHFMAQSGGSGMQYNQGGSQGLNPVLGQALTAMLASQGAGGGVGLGGGLGLTNLLGSTLGNTSVNLTAPPMMNSAIQGGYGNQFGSGYGSQPSIQGGYSHSQMGQGSGGRSQRGGYMGGVNPYTGH